MGLRQHLPGIATLVLVGAGTRSTAAAVGVNDLVLAIVAGVLIGNLVGVPSWAARGVENHKLFLETGIVLLGASIAIEELIGAGPRVVALVVGTVAFGLLLVEAIARGVFGLHGKTASLLAAGTSICGVSAVAAVGQVVDARGDQLTYAAATIVFFDAITLVLYPILGDLLALNAREFGVWAGLSMFSTGPVAAAGFAHSPEAGQWATVTKLARNTLLGAVVVAYSIGYATRKANDPGIKRLWLQFPKFLVGFLLVALVANLGVLTPASLEGIGRTSEWLFVLAFVGLGFEIRPARMRESGLTPVVTVLCAFCVISLVTLLVVRALL
ncbi:YeiH family protein [Halalkalicoccus sp. NIPERK01]|uniref:YeiH family protein n=1 Tax=Halalkalicoccus sp. NIPERK01 TaxID=3053469 RepID=UPI00256F10CC|nr:putative sulfate exporter family transporter [Halalkalicoccus sp. NIPERK01]MDL5362547.1 putative sulfate exporter family transporter [Halalkalicoccus sp. NIPERK01]